MAGEQEFGGRGDDRAGSRSADDADDAGGPAAPAVPPRSTRRRSVLAGGVLAVLAVAGSGVTAALAGGAGSVVAPAAVGGAVPPDGPPLGPGTRECADRQDPALRALVDRALPEVAGAPEAVTTTECRPGGERAVALQVRDGASSGLLSVTSLPPGSAVDAADGARTGPTASGGTVVVTSRADRFGDPAPFAGRLDTVVAALGPRL